MDLHVIHVFQLNAMFACNATRIAGEAREVRRVLVKTADAAGRHDCEARANTIRIALRVFCDNAAAHIVLLDDVDHSRVRANLDVALLAHCCQ